MVRTLLLLGAILTAPGVHAQAAAGARTLASGTDAVLPDIEFRATVHMDSIRFQGAPRAEVRITGGPQIEQRHEVGRDGLPVPVPVGRTYRNATVRTTIAATLLDPALQADAQVQAGAPAPASPPNDSEDSP